MVDREKVMHSLEQCITGCNRSCAYYDASYCLASLERDALELLKEQEPKLVAITTNSYGTKFYHCPRCNHDLYAYPRQIYCSQCGQEVKWE